MSERQAPQRHRAAEIVCTLNIRVNLNLRASDKDVLLNLLSQV